MIRVLGGEDALNLDGGGSLYAVEWGRCRLRE